MDYRGPGEKTETLKIVPAINDQELAAERSTRTIYWEGSAKAAGVMEGEPIEGNGYVELTGYAQSIGGWL